MVKGRKIFIAFLREQILSMELLPGCSLDESGLAEQFGVSRSPVRQALLQLTVNGLATSLPNKSAIVSPLNVELFPQYIDALDLIQRTVSHLAALYRTEKDLKSIRDRQGTYSKSVNSGSVVSMIESNREFHMAIGIASGNVYFSNQYAHLLDEGRRFLRIYFRSYNDEMPAEFPDEHGAIIDAIEAKDHKRAEQLAHQHTMEFHGRFIDYMKNLKTSDIALELFSD